MKTLKVRAVEHEFTNASGEALCGNHLAMSLDRIDGFGSKARFARNKLEAVLAGDPDWEVCAGLARVLSEENRALRIAQVASEAILRDLERERSKVLATKGEPNRNSPKPET